MCVEIVLQIKTSEDKISDQLENKTRIYITPTIVEALESSVFSLMDTNITIYCYTKGTISLFGGFFFRITH